MVAGNNCIMPFSASGVLEAKSGVLTLHPQTNLVPVRWRRAGPCKSRMTTNQACIALCLMVLLPFTTPNASFKNHYTNRSY